MSAKTRFAVMFAEDYSRARTFLAPAQYMTALTVAGGDDTAERRRVMAEYVWRTYVDTRDSDPFLLEDLHREYIQS